MIPWERNPRIKNSRKKGPRKNDPREKKILEKCPQKMVLRQKNARKFERIFYFFRYKKLCKMLLNAWLQ